jgi:hypothetical protein
VWAAETALEMGVVVRLSGSMWSARWSWLEAVAGFYGGQSPGRRKQNRSGKGKVGSWSVGVGQAREADGSAERGKSYWVRGKLGGWVFGGELGKRWLWEQKSQSRGSGGFGWFW